MVDVTSDTSAKVIVSGIGSEIDAGPSVNVGGETVYDNAGTGEILVQNGGIFRAFDRTDLQSGAAVIVTGAGSVLQTSQIEVDAQASLQVASGGSLQAAIFNLDGGTVVLTSGTLNLHSEYDAQSGNLIGAGLLAAPKIINGGLIDAKGGTLHLTGSITGTGALHIETGSTLQIDGNAVVNQTLTFESGANTLALADPSGFAATIFDFAPGDAIDLLNTTATSLSYVTGALSVFNGSTKLAHLRLAGSYAKANFHLAADGHGGTVVSYAASAPAAAPTPHLFWPVLHH